MSSKDVVREQERAIKQLLLDKQQVDRAFQAAYKLYSERLYWHIRNLVLVHADADDVVQNTWIKAYKNLKNFNWDASLYTWLYRIGTNESINFLKKNRARFGNESQYHLDLQKRLQADPYFDESEATLLLEQAIKQLSDRERLVFNLRYFEGMAYEQIAELTKGNINTLKVQFRNAKKKIMHTIENFD